MPALRQFDLSDSGIEMRTLERLLSSAAVAVVLTSLLPGCQCCSWTERAGDLVDQFNDRDCHADSLYHPGTDLTRIGRSDWNAYYGTKSHSLRGRCYEGACPDPYCRHHLGVPQPPAWQQRRDRWAWFD